MKLLLALILLTCTAGAQSRYVTIEAEHSWFTNDYGTRRLASNSVEIASGEVVKIVGVQSPNPIFEYEVGIYLHRGSRRSGAVKGDIIVGPTRLSMVSNYDADPNYDYLLTLEYLPQSFPPGRTVIVPAGTNTVSVRLESSTNLVTWSVTSNGVYGPFPEGQFFRAVVEK